MDCISDDLYIYIIHTYWNAMHFKLNLQITTLHEHIKFHIFELWRMLEGMIDLRSYVHNLSNCEIKAWKKIQALMGLPASSQIAW